MSGRAEGIHEGGPGSGNFGHGGIPGQKGGSTSGVSGGEYQDNHISWKSEDTVTGRTVIEYPSDQDAPDEAAIKSFIKQNPPADGLEPDDIEDIPSLKITDSGSGWVEVEVDITPTKAAGDRWMDKQAGGEEWNLYHESKAVKLGEPYANVPESLWDKMDRCVQHVQDKQPDIDKKGAIAICYTSIVEGKPLTEAIFDNEAFMKRQIAEAEKPVKTEGGKAYPKGDFAYAPSDAPGSWKLRLTSEPDGDPDPRIVGAAIAALGKGFRGSKVEIPEGDLPAVKAKVRAAWKKANPDAKPEDVPPAIKEAAVIAECGPMVATPENYVPWGITNFADLEAHQAAQESAHEISELTGQYQAMVGNIMSSPDITNKAQAVNALTQEFIGMVAAKTGEVTMETGEVGKRVKSEMRDRLKEIKKQMDELMSWADYDDEDAQDAPVEKPSAHKESEPVEAIVMELSESASGAAIDIAEDDAPPTVNDKRSPLKLNVQLIRPGWGNKSDNNYYSAEVLKRDAHLFEGAKMYPTDHRQDMKSALNEVSIIEKIVGFSDSGAPIARVSIFDPEFAEKTRNRAEDGKLNTLECSILAKGSARPGVIDGRKGNIVEAITEAHSVDWVTRAGAGGQALTLAESEKSKQGENMQNEPNTPLTETEQVAPSPAAVTTPVTISEGAPAETPAPASTPAVLAEAEVIALLSASHLPDALKEIMRERQYKDQAEFEATHAKMIERAKALTGSGQPFGLGASRNEPAKVRVTDQDLAEVQRAVNTKYFGGRK